MSKIGKKPIQVKEGVAVHVENNVVIVTGPKGSQSMSVPTPISVSMQDGNVVISQKQDISNTASLFGLVRATVANMIQGVTEGFEKKLELSGVGYRAQLLGNDLVLSVGFSHPVKIKAGPDIKFSVQENVITISGMDKMLVGDMAAKIRSIRPPEPYKGKGIKYVGEHIRRKAGKAAKAVGAK